MCDCKSRCPRCDPPERLRANQYRPSSYWADLLGVSVQTIYNQFEDDFRWFGGRKLLSKKAVDRRYPDLIEAA